MDLSKILDKDCVQIGVEPADKQSVLETIARLAKKSGILAGVSEETVFKALQERENLGSTGFGKGIAIPHCVLDNVSDFVVGILTAPDGVDFKSLDKKKTKVLVFIIGPSTERNRHISILATVSHVFCIPGFTEELLVEKDPSAVRERFLRYSLEKVDTKAQIDSCIFHVFVQDESKFYDILEVFTAVESCSVSVTEARDASAFLYKLPLFSSFWREDRHGFNRIITAVVRKSLANNTIRQINDIVGGLDKHPGIMLAVQDIFYTAGLLST